MNLTIYRGTNQICGNCIELEHNNTRILLDFGIPLEAMDMKDCKIEDFKPTIKNKFVSEGLRIFIRQNSNSSDLILHNLRISHFVVPLFSFFLSTYSSHYRTVS